MKAINIKNLTVILKLQKVAPDYMSRKPSTVNLEKIFKLKEKVKLKLFLLHHKFVYDDLDLDSSDYHLAFYSMKVASQSGYLYWSAVSFMPSSFLLSSS